MRTVAFKLAILLFHMWKYKLTLKFRAKIKEYPVRYFVAFDIIDFISWLWPLI